MHEDLRRRALESTKTVSRKQRSKQSSASASKLGSGLSSGTNSRPASRAVSRNGSDDEDGSEFSDGGGSGTASIDGVLSGADEDEGPTGNWQEELQTRISRILDRNRKNASAAGREEDLAWYVSVSRVRYTQPQITSQLSDLYNAFLKSLKEDTSETEKLLALEAIGITTITDPTKEEGLAYQACSKALQSALYDSDSHRVKAEATRALALTAFFSSDDDAVEQEIMPLLVSIIETDGAQVTADDSSEVVSAAISSWSLLATYVEDLQEASEEAMEALVDQLSSSSTSVQIAAGEAIALAYEKSYTEVESDEEISDDEAEEDHKQGANTVRRYDPFRRKDELLAQLSSIGKLSTKSRSKRDRKELHASFQDIHQSVENPRLGPRYSNAIDDETGRYYGSRLTIRVGKNSKMTIDKWWKLIRLEVLRKWLKGGFLEHYQKNEVVLDMLPIIAR